MEGQVSRFPFLFHTNTILSLNYNQHDNMSSVTQHTDNWHPRYTGEILKYVYVYHAQQA